MVSKMKKKMIAIMIVCSMLAGCAEGIPDPTDIFNECEDPELETFSGEVTILENETYTPLQFGNETKWLEVVSSSMTATHLSFEVVNNTVIFNNLSFTELDVYLYQEIATTYSVTIPVNQTSNVTENYTFEDVDSIFFTRGTAPQLGLVTLYVPEFSYDITVTYTISYRLLDGKECL